MSWIATEAQRTADDFAQTIRQKFSIAQELTPEEYEKYKTAMDQFHAAVISAVTDAANVVKHLSKEDKEKNKKPVAPVPAANPVPTPLPSV